MVIGVAFETMLGVGFLGLIVVYCLDVSIVDLKLGRLRRTKIVQKVGNDDLFQTMQPILVPKNKYNNTVKF